MSERKQIPESPAWEDDYQSLLARAEQNRRNRARVDPERRAHPRFQLRGRIGVQLQAEVPAVDISSEGVSFRCSMPLPVGKRVNVVLAPAFLSEVEVVACDPEVMPDHPDCAWRIHGRFQHAAEGRRILVLLESMGSLDPTDVL